MKKWRVLFYEPDETGHHFAYLGRMLPGFVDLPVEIALATTPAALASHEFAACLAPYRERMHVLDLCTARPRGQWANAWHRLRELKKCVQHWHPDHVCVMYAAGLWQLWSLLSMFGYRVLPRDVSAEMWVYRGGFAYPDATGVGNVVKRSLFRRLLRQGDLCKVHPVDELLYQFAVRVPKRRAQVQLAPDPIRFGPPIDRQTARLKLDLPTQGRLMSRVGMVARRTGADLSLRAFAELLAAHPDEHRDTRLLLAGPHEAEILQLLETPTYSQLRERGQLISLNRFLSDEEMLAVAAASDLVLAAYPNHSGRSSIILWAAAAGRPVLGVDRGCIAYVIEKERLGTTCDVDNPVAFAAAMRQSLATSWTMYDQQRVRAYARWHSVENYQRLASCYLREHCTPAREAALVFPFVRTPA